MYLCTSFLIISEIFTSQTDGDDAAYFAILIFFSGFGGGGRGLVYFGIGTILTDLIYHRVL